MHIYRLERSVSGMLTLKKGLETYMFKGAKGDFRMGHILHSEEFFIERALAGEQIVDDVVFKPHRSVKGRMIALRSNDDGVRVFFGENTFAFTEDVVNNKCDSMDCFHCKLKEKYPPSELMSRMEKLTLSSYIDLEVGESFIIGSLLLNECSGHCNQLKSLVHTYKVTRTEFGVEFTPFSKYDCSNILA